MLQKATFAPWVGRRPSAPACVQCYRQCWREWENVGEQGESIKQGQGAAKWRGGREDASHWQQRMALPAAIKTARGAQPRGRGAAACPQAPSCVVVVLYALGTSGGALRDLRTKLPGLPKTVRHKRRPAPGASRRRWRAASGAAQPACHHRPIEPAGVHATQAISDGRAGCPSGRRAGRLPAVQGTGRGCCRQPGR